MREEGGGVGVGGGFREWRLGHASTVHDGTKEASIAVIRMNLY